jgi:hypothetical protein
MTYSAAVTRSIAAEGYFPPAIYCPMGAVLISCLASPRKAATLGIGRIMPFSQPLRCPGDSRTTDRGKGYCYKMISKNGIAFHPPP